MNENDVYRASRKLVDNLFGIDRAELKKDINAASRDFRKIRDKLANKAKVSIQKFVDTLSIDEVLQLMEILEKRLK